jgi:tRNA threonylcarbamoyladenosine biosynthesis protein TsaE
LDIFITTSVRKTQKLGEMLARELKGGVIICLTGELGSGKTTFSQGVLKGLGVKGPHTSPTFVVMKKYRVKSYQSSTFPFPDKSGNSSKPSFIQNAYHIDAYRVGPKDILDLGWKEIISDKKNIVIVEWAERMRLIIPKNAIWIRFRHKEKNEREIIIKSQCQNPNDK